MVRGVRKHIVFWPAGLVLAAGIASLLVWALSGAGPAQSQASPSQSQASPSNGVSPALAVCTSLAQKLSQEMGNEVSVAGAFQSTTGAMAEWREMPRPFDSGSEPPGESHFRTYSPDRKVSLCYLDGEFGGVPCGPPPLGTPRPCVYQRALMLVIEGGRLEDGACCELDTALRTRDLPMTAPPGAQ